MGSYSLASLGPLMYRMPHHLHMHMHMHVLQVHLARASI